MPNTRRNILQQYAGWIQIDQLIPLPPLRPEIPPRLGVSFSRNFVVSSKIMPLLSGGLVRRAFLLWAYGRRRSKAYQQITGLDIWWSMDIGVVNGEKNGNVIGFCEWKEDLSFIIFFCHSVIVGVFFSDTFYNFHFISHCYPELPFNQLNVVRKKILSGNHKTERPANRVLQRTLIIRSFPKFRYGRFRRSVLTMVIELNFLVL